MDEVQFAQLENTVYGMQVNIQDLSSQVKLLSNMTERLIRLEERQTHRDEGIKRAHDRIDIAEDECEEQYKSVTGHIKEVKKEINGRLNFWLSMILTGGGAVALAVFSNWLTINNHH